MMSMKCLLSAAPVLLSGCAAVAAEKLNVLFIAIDDLRPELGCYGSAQVKSPKLDRLGSQGTLFSRAYCQVPVCGASRACLMTGVMPTAKRFVSYKTYAEKDAPTAQTLPGAFRDAGYTTLSNGKIFHHRDDTQARSWSEPAWHPEDVYRKSYDPETLKRKSSRGRGRIYELPDVADDAYPDGQIARKTIEDLQRLKADGKPFFLACGFIRPHMPFYAPKRYWDLYDRDKIEIASNRDRPKNAPSELRGSGEYRSYHLGDYKDGSDDFHRMMRHGYLASVSYVDKLVGDVLAELDRLELADNTVVVVWGDHGWHLGEHNFWGKHNTMHLAMRVPLIVRVPGKAAGESSALVDTIDIYPTLCALAGVDTPHTVQGRSFMSLLEDPTVSFREVAYSRFGPGDAVITDRFTYTSYRDGKSEMLYDLQEDPAENENIAARPEHRKTVERMRELLREQKAEANRAEGVAGIAPAGEAHKKEERPKMKQTKADNAPGYEGKVPMPTFSSIRYGEHERHILDFWQAESDKPTPLVLVIHGGGWTAGSKERLSRFADVDELLKAGISVAANNYRLMKHAQDVVPPVKAPMLDSARALQFLRSKAKEWNIDSGRIGLAGGSAGACTSLWLAIMMISRIPITKTRCCANQPAYSAQG